MALGECGYEPALPLLSELRNEVIEATMVYVAIGDSLVRLSKPEQNDVSAVLEILEGENRMLSNGALRAMAMLKLIPSDSDANAILQYARACEVNDGTHFWVVAAAPGWSGPQLESYLNYCEKSERQDIIDALLLARKKKYKKWNPL